MYFSFVKKISFIGLLLLATSVCGQQHNIRNYSVWDGLAQSQVYDMIEDRSGNIWMATWGGGISKFDGINFTGLTKSDGLISNYVECMVLDDSGGIWIGTKAGVSFYDGAGFTNHYLDPDSIPVRVHDLTIDGDGKVWLATASGLYEWNESGFKASDLMTEPIWCIAFEQDQLWFGTDEGLHTVSGNVFTTYNRDNGLSYRKVRSIGANSNGDLLIGTYGGGLDQWNGSKFTSVTDQFGLPTGIIQGLMVDDEENIWMATLREGVVRLNAADSSVTYIKDVDGLANNHVRCFLSDTWGNVWIGTSGGGVSKYIGQTFVHFTEENGLADDYVYSVLVDDQDRLWAGTGVKGITRLDTSGWTYFNADTGFFDVKCKTLFQDSRGALWLGTDGRGIVRYTDSSWHYLGADQGMSDTWIRDIAEDSDGFIWVATAGGGISVIQPPLMNEYIVSPITTTHGLPSDRLITIHIDTNDVAWVGSDNAGLFYVVRDTSNSDLFVDVKVVQTVPGLRSDNITSLVEDEYGYLWVGTAGNGVSRIDIYSDRPAVVHFDQENGLSSNGVILMAIDGEGNLWVGTEKGVDQVYLDQERNFSSVKHFGQAEGFIGVETCRNAVTVDDHGNIWFGTINGLTRYNPDQRRSNPIPPILSFTELSLFYQPIQNTEYSEIIGPWGQIVGELVLPYNENHLGFEFFGVNHSNPTSVRYQWMLEGYDDDWTPISARTNTNYSNLPAGEYSFLVKASNEDGIWSDPIRFSFSIQPPYWETWWFRAAVGGGAFLIIVLIFNWRVRAYRSKSKRIRERLKMEKELVQLEQKALRLQMNPHFIFNSLNSIQALITKKDDKSARYLLAKFSKLMRQILENSREATITLDEEIETLTNYMELERFTRGESFDYEFILTDDIETELLEVPPMMIQPFIENSIIHGLKELPRRGRITVSFSLDDTTLICSIEDNGIGREAAASNKAQQDNRHKSTALIVTQERLDRMSQDGGESSLEFIDLKDGDGNATGTRVVLRIPV